ncbi:MAG: nitroreductase family protein [Lachnospiraceae bacterium]|nr:nitroreductase family protein [Lachnospiraceae bacterium]
MENFLDLVKTRRSVRTFDGKAISDNIMEKLKKYAEADVNPFQIPVTYGFHSAAEQNLSSPVITDAPCFVTAKINAGKNADVAYGYSFQNFLMYAHSLGLGTVLIGGTMPRDKFEQAAQLQDGEIMPCMSPLGYCAEKMTLKETMMRKGTGADKRMDFEKLFFKNDFSTPLTPLEAQAECIYDALEALRWAPSAVNKQPWRVVVCENTFHFYEKKNKGYDNGIYDVQKVDMGIAMYNFAHMLETQDKHPTLVLADPGIRIENDMEYIASFQL